MRVVIIYRDKLAQNVLGSYQTTDIGEGILDLSCQFITVFQRPKARLAWKCLYIHFLNLGSYIK